MIWSPTTEEEIAQNVRSLASLAQGEQPLARGMGLALSAVDSPMPAAEALLISDLVAQIEEHEPRAEVARVIVSQAGDGALKAEVRLR